MKTHRLIPVLPGSEQVHGISAEPAKRVKTAIETAKRI